MRRVHRGKAAIPAHVQSSKKEIRTGMGEPCVENRLSENSGRARSFGICHSIIYSIKIPSTATTPVVVLAPALHRFDDWTESDPARANRIIAARKFSTSAGWNFEIFNYFCFGLFERSLRPFIPAPKNFAYGFHFGIKRLFASDISDRYRISIQSGVINIAHEGG